MVNLFSRLEGQVINVQEADKLRWDSDKDGKYSVKASYVISFAPNGVLDNWPWKLIWKTKLPPKIICFSWTALHEACLTQDNLKKRKFQIANRCYMCHQNIESNNHLFLHCTVVAGLLCMFLSIFNINWAMPRSTKEPLSVGAIGELVSPSSQSGR